MDASEDMSAVSLFLLFLMLLVTSLLLAGCGNGDEGDLIAPELTLNAVNPSTFERQKFLSGTIEMGADVDITVDTDAQIIEVVVKEGHWSCTISELEVGGNAVTVTASDAKGNTKHLIFTLTYDIIKIDQLDAVTANETPTIYGTLAPGGIIDSIIVNSVELDIPVTIEGTQWNFAISPTFPLVSGTNTLSIIAVDSLISPQTQELYYEVAQDETVAPLTVTPVNSPISDNSITLMGTKASGAEVTVAVEPLAIVSDTEYPTETSWQVDVTSLEERDSIITVTSDLAGMADATTWARVSVYSEPQVWATLPPAGSQDVLLDTELLVIFSEAMNGSSIHENSFYVTGPDGALLPGTVSYAPETTSAFFEFDMPLTSASSYVATLTSEVVDPSGKPIEEYSWQFTTY